jgi:F0F1-type ATP synthase membrane subunit b/b'
MTLDLIFCLLGFLLPLILTKPLFKSLDNQLKDIENDLKKR